MRFKRNCIRRIVSTAVALLCIAGASGCSSLARYKSAANAENDVRVAAFVLMADDTNNSFSLDVTDVDPSFNKSYTFSVGNTDGSRICEVAQAYTVEITDFGNLPLRYELTKDGSGVSVTDGVTGKVNLPAGVAETHEYTLNVTWDGTQISSDFSDEVDLIKVEIRSEQID